MTELALGGQVSGTVIAETELSWDCDEVAEETALTGSPSGRYSKAD